MRTASLVDRQDYDLNMGQEDIFINSDNYMVNKLDIILGIWAPVMSKVIEDENTLKYILKRRGKSGEIR